MQSLIEKLENKFKQIEIKKQFQYTYQLLSIIYT